MTYRSKVGPIPEENFENDTKFVPPEKMDDSQREFLERMNAKLFDTRKPKAP